MGFFSDLFADANQDKAVKEVSPQECFQMVGRFLTECGLEPESCMLEEEEGLGWTIQNGSAAIHILLAQNEMLEEVTIEVFSPILKIPTQNVLPFYRRCLETNRYLVGCALCVSSDNVLIVAERALSGLDYEELERMILSVAEAADAMDDELAKEFGAQLVGAS
jgi:hypothetical protein